MNVNENKPEWGPIREIPLTQARVAHVREIDFDLAKDNWAYTPGGASRGGGILMHRVIAERMGLDLAYKVGHADGDCTNNDRGNLVQLKSRVPRKRK